MTKRNPWSYGKKNGFLGRKPSFRVNKKTHFFTLTIFWPWPGKVVERKKYLCPKKYQSFSKFLVLFEEKTDFWSKNAFRPNVKTALSPEFRCHYGSFFDGPDRPTELRYWGPKLRVLIIAK